MSDQSARTETRGRKFLVLALSLLLTTQAWAQLFPGRTDNILSESGRPRPLPMDQAFPFFVSIVDERTLHVTWQIAPQHYLYRQQFGFALHVPGAAGLQTLTFSLPDGIAKDDPFFGAVEVYFDAVTATVRTTEASLPSGTAIEIQYQGCAEWGFCYPPQTASYLLVP